MRVAVRIETPELAWIKTGFAAGRSAGAEYKALPAPVIAIVPSVELPPGIPSTSQDIGAVPAAQNVAVRFCDCPSPTLAAVGEIAFGFAQLIVTEALLDLELSATLVAVTVTEAGDGTVAGAV